MKANDSETVTLQPGSVRVAQSSFAFQLHRHLAFTDLRSIAVGTRPLSVLVLENGYYLLELHIPASPDTMAEVQQKRPGSAQAPPVARKPKRKTGPAR